MAECLFLDDYVQKKTQQVNHLKYEVNSQFHYAMTLAKTKLVQLTTMNRKVQEVARSRVIYYCLRFCPYVLGCHSRL
jgi:hypothetical protein